MYIRVFVAIIQHDNLCVGLKDFLEPSDMPDFRIAGTLTKNNISPVFQYVVEKVSNIIHTEYYPKII